MTDDARAALAQLRDPSQFEWYVIPLLLLVLYVYAAEVERRNAGERHKAGAGGSAATRGAPYSPGGQDSGRRPG